MALDGKIKHFVLFDYGLFNKIFDKVKYILSKIDGITNSIFIILERSELIHIIFQLLNKY